MNHSRQTTKQIHTCMNKHFNIKNFQHFVTDTLYDIPQFVTASAK